MSDIPKRICIVGGGFGGLYTALRLNELPWEDHTKPEIILIDQCDRFLFLPLLYELVADEMQTWEIAPPFAELLADTGIKFQQGKVTAIDVDSQQIHLQDHPNLSYDKLVIAIGGKTPFGSVTGAKEYAIPFRTLEDAYCLKEKLRMLRAAKAEKIRVAIVGGGFSGVELAGKLGDYLGAIGRIRLIERGDTILPNSAEFNRNTAIKALEARKVWLDLETEVTQITENEISLLYKGQIDTIPVDIVLWTVGTQVSDLIRNLPLPHNPQGLLKIEPTLQVVENGDIFALGDVVEAIDATGQQLSHTAQVAIQQADYCAWNLWAQLSHRPLLPFRYQALGEMMALGTDEAVLSGLGVKLDGNLAYLARRLVYLYRLPTLKHQIAVGFNWITQPLIDLIKL